LRGTPGGACPQPTAHSPSQVPVAPPSPISARAAQRRWRRWWRGEEGARRPGPEGIVLRHVLWHVLRSVLRSVLHRILHVAFVLHVSPKGRRGGGTSVLAWVLRPPWPRTGPRPGSGSRPGRRAPQHTFLPPDKLRSPRPLRARPSRVDRHCHWACRTNKGLRTIKKRLARR